jgi:membrane-associated HD superfamily phosphohydrolase
VGDVAARTVKSPRTVSFESSFLTLQRQDEAESAVRPSLVFDASVRTTQIAKYDKAIEQATQILTQSTDLPGSVMRWRPPDLTQEHRHGCGTDPIAGSRWWPRVAACSRKN